MKEVLVILQLGYRSRGGLTMPYDSTQNTGPGFGIFVAAVFLFLAVGIIKAYRDDKKWKGRVMNRPQKIKKGSNGSHA